jgi:uncharacterized membrane protein
MRRYSPDEEERIHTQSLVREWTRSGLLDAAQGERLGAELRVELRRTNPFLRAGLAVFTALIVAASVGLFIALFDPNGDASNAVITGPRSPAHAGGVSGPRIPLLSLRRREALAVASSCCSASAERS